MPNQENEKKPKQEQPKGPETPEQAAARAAGVAQAGKEQQAAAALAGAEQAGESETGVVEKKKIQDLGYVHIDDQPDFLRQVQAIVADKLLMGNKLGEARSRAEAIALVKRLLQEGQRIDLIFLDRDFPNSADDEVGDDKAGDKFLRDFERLAQDPGFQDKLRDTRIIMMTSHAMHAPTMEAFKKLSPRVIGGLVGKGLDEQDPDKIKQMLIDAGVIEKG